MLGPPSELCDPSFLSRLLALIRFDSWPAILRSYYSLSWIHLTKPASSAAETKLD